MAGRVMRRPRGKSERVPVWAGFAFGPVATTAAGTLAATANAALLALRSFTIIRTRGVFLVTSDQSAASETLSGVLAASVVSEISTAAAASVPMPIDEPSYPYWLFEPYVHEIAFSSSVGVETPVGTYTRFDSKAMRKVGLEQDIAVVAQSGTPELQIITLEGRVLVKLH